MLRSNKPKKKKKNQRKKVSKQDLQSTQGLLLYNKAQRLLSYRPRSVAELRLRLTQYSKKKKIALSLVDESLKLLIEEGSIDDSKFAQWWIEQRSEFSPRGRRGLIAELKAKGVDEEIIRQTIELLWQDEVDVFGVKRERLEDKLLAEKAATKKLKIYKLENKIVFREKMVRYLLRRGFDYDTANDVLQNLIEKYYD